MGRVTFERDDLAAFDHEDLVAIAADHPELHGRHGPVDELAALKPLATTDREALVDLLVGRRRPVSVPVIGTDGGTSATYWY